MIKSLPELRQDFISENKEFYQQAFEKIRDVSAVSLHTPNGKDDPEARAKLVALINQRHKGWDNDSLKVIYGGEMPDVAAWFDVNEVFPLGSLEFEGHSFSAPKNPEHYLGAIYSFNFMELPPENKRLTHAHSIEFS